MCQSGCFVAQQPLPIQSILFGVKGALSVVTDNYLKRVDYLESSEFSYKAPAIKVKSKPANNAHIAMW